MPSSRGLYIYIVCAYIITYCLFTLLIVSFGAQKFSISMNFIYVFFYIFYLLLTVFFGVISKEFLMFPFFLLPFLIHFEFIFVHGVR